MQANLIPLFTITETAINFIGRKKNRIKNFKQTILITTAEVFASATYPIVMSLLIKEQGFLVPEQFSVQEQKEG